MQHWTEIGEDDFTQCAELVDGSARLVEQPRKKVNFIGTAISDYKEQPSFLKEPSHFYHCGRTRQTYWLTSLNQYQKGVNIFIHHLYEFKSQQFKSNQAIAMKSQITNIMVPRKNWKDATDSKVNSCCPSSQVKMTKVSSCKHRINYFQHMLLMF